MQNIVGWPGWTAQIWYVPVMACHHDTSADMQEITQVLFWSTASMCQHGHAATARTAHEGRAGRRWGEVLAHGGQRTTRPSLRCKAKLEGRGLKENGWGLCSSLP